MLGNTTNNDLSVLEQRLAYIHNKWRIKEITHVLQAKMTILFKLWIDYRYLTWIILMIGKVVLNWGIIHMSAKTREESTILFFYSLNI